ncbi:hypothetical protein C8A00DRAFT_17329 [Chaetomidium leptoderma]|uniref:Uncharacterized protein n=1 Tax=Chaetomidium leptoderma TaxID=669021 RepID=A0AAN6VGT7_9PEZI|nr:hypothetical protein C8A00DRAFT_17329 [Chaetomidium leptoderma]
MFPSRVVSSSSRSLVPALRAARAALLKNASFHPLAPIHHGQCVQQRHYAMMRSPSLTRRARARAVQGGLLFKPSDTPPVAVWEQFKLHYDLGDLTAQDCHKAAVHYCDLATNDSSAWRETLERDHGIDSYTLHYTALPLASRGTASHMGLHMLLTASILGYAPSTLTLMSILVRLNKKDFLAMKPSFREAEAHFNRLVQAENPDALTLQGLVLLHGDRPTATALKYFDKAIKVARSIPPKAVSQPEPASQDSPAIREPRWSFEGSCHQKRGLILLEHNRTEEAIAAFKIAALELDLADGYAELVKLMPRDAPERETYLLKAAQGCNPEACQLLALEMADKASDPGLSMKDRVYAGRMAREWVQAHPDPGKREEVEAMVAEKTREVTKG